MAEACGVPIKAGQGFLPRLWRLLMPRLVMALVMSVQALSAQGAQTPTELDEHVNRLTAELRCLVCQNQTIADSHAELAMQLKKEVRQQLTRGASDQDVRDFMVQRYGDFVLYRPPVNPLTWLLWGGPLLLLALAGGFMAWHWRERRALLREVPDSILPPEETAA